MTIAQMLQTLRLDRGESSIRPARHSIEMPSLQSRCLPRLFPPIAERSPVAGA
jgi:hypothetical protein